MKMRTNRTFGIIVLGITILVELGILTGCYFILRMMTPPAVGVVLGLSIITAALLLLEGLKMPFAYLFHSLRAWWAKGIVLLLLIGISLSTAETIISGTSWTFQETVKPAYQAENQIKELKSNIDILEKENANLKSGSSETLDRISNIKLAAKDQREQEKAAGDANLARIDEALAKLDQDSKRLSPADDNRIRDRKERIAQEEQSRDRRLTKLNPAEGRIKGKIGRFTKQAEMRIQSLQSDLSQLEKEAKEEAKQIREGYKDRLEAAKSSSETRLKEIRARMEDIRVEIKSIPDDLRQRIAFHEEHNKAFYGKDKKIEQDRQQAEMRQSRLESELGVFRQEQKSLQEQTKTTELMVSMNKDLAAAQSDSNSRKLELRKKIKIARNDRDEQINNLNLELVSHQRSLTNEEDRIREQSDERIAEWQSEIATIQERAAAELSSQDKTIRLEHARLTKERSTLRQHMAETDLRIAAKCENEIAELTPSLSEGETRKQRGENEKAILATQSKITKLETAAKEAYKKSFVYQLARVVSKTDTPTKDEMHFTLRVLLPVVALLISIIPWVGLKLALLNLTQRRRNTTIGSLRKKVSGKAKIIVDRKQVELDNAKIRTDKAIADLKTAQKKFSKDSDRVREENRENGRKSQEKIQAIYEECESRIELNRVRAESEARKEVGGQLDEQSKTIGKHEGTIDILTRENGRLTTINDQLVEDIGELKQEVLELLEKPIAQIHIDNRAKKTG